MNAKAPTQKLTTERKCYRMEKEGEQTLFGYLDEHEVMFWVRKGYTVTRNGENLH